MANMLIGYDNLVTRASTTVTADSEVAALPASNLKHSNLRRRFRTDPGITNVNIIVDFGEAVQVDVVALLQPLDCGGVDADNAARGWMAVNDKVRHRFDLVTPGAGVVLDSTAIDCGIVPRFGIHVWQLPETKTVRYWHLNVNAASLAATLECIDLGYLFAGPALRPARNFAYGHGIQVQDYSTVIRSARSGVRQSEEGPRARVRNLGLPYLNKTEAEQQLLDMYLQNGITRPYLVVPNPASTQLGREAIIGTMLSVPPITQPNFTMFETVLQLEQLI